MFARHRAVLRLLENEDGIASRLRLVKLEFLLSREPRAPKSGIYEFVPYRRGPFSFTLYHDLLGLQHDGWIAPVGHDIRLAQAADLETALLDPDFVEVIDSISSRHRSISTEALIDRVYTTHPWFTINTESVHKRAMVRPKAALCVYTVGYEGIMVDGLLDLLLRNGVKRLIDVRCNPIARRYGFHKSTLTRLCADVDIEYRHFPSLGITSAWRTELNDRKSYERLWVRYEQEILPAQEAAIGDVERLIGERPSALMCMEADHTCCHRSRLAALISLRTELPIRELR